MTEELKPCPFCGGEAGIIKQYEDGKCAVGCKGSCPMLIEIRENSAKNWNTRYGEKDQ